MAPSEVLGALGEDDLDAALALSAEAGWNQVRADWALMLAAGEGTAARADERVVATAVALPYAPRLGWISMVLVTARARRRGLATRLVEHASARLRASDLLPVLDATPAGAAVYGRMGFVPGEPITRWRGAGGGGGGIGADLDVADVAALDADAFGADRSAILRDLATRPGALALGDGDGFLLARVGRTATQLGPCVAGDPARATRLLAAAVDAIAGTVIVDVPDRAFAAVALLERCAFVAERPFVRMALGRELTRGTPALVHAIAGPELG